MKSPKLRALGTLGLAVGVFASCSAGSGGGTQVHGGSGAPGTGGSGHGAAGTAVGSDSPRHSRAARPSLSLGVVALDLESARVFDQQRERRRHDPEDFGVASELESTRLEQLAPESAGQDRLSGSARYHRALHGRGTV